MSAQDRQVTAFPHITLCFPAFPPAGRWDPEKEAEELCPARLAGTGDVAEKAASEVGAQSLQLILKDCVVSRGSCGVACAFGLHCNSSLPRRSGMGKLWGLAATWGACLASERRIWAFTCSRPAGLRREKLRQGLAGESLKAVGPKDANASHPCTALRLQCHVACSPLVQASGILELAGVAEMADAEPQFNQLLNCEWPWG